MAFRRLYEPTGVVLARVTTDPGDLDLPEQLNIYDAAGVETGWRWLTQIWQRPEVRAALQLASAALAQQISDALDLDKIDASAIETARRRRLILAAVSYLLRWRGRPTPFGLFAGVMAVRSGREAAVAFGAAHRLLVRPDGVWLAALIDRFERHPGLLPRLSVIVNNCGIVRGDRFVVPGKPSDGAGPGPLAETSVRHSRPVRAALEAAAQPIRFDELSARLAADFPTARTETIQTLLAHLVEQGVLLTNLRPPSTIVHGLAYLEAQLHAAGGDELPDLASVLADLADIGRKLARHNTGVPPADGDTIRRGAAARMNALCGDAEQVLAADTAVDGAITVPTTVVNEAAAAASVLVRLTAQPFGTDDWKDFHVRFRDRYGPGALVPVRDLIADSGLGLPTGFLGAPRRRATRAMTDRDAELLALIQQATIDGRQEIELTEQVISALTLGEPDELIPPPRVELAFTVRADSPEALNRGRFQLWVTGAPRPASSMAGRFTHLLPETTRDLLATSYTTDGSHTEGAVAAQLSFPPRRLRGDHVVRVPPLLPAVISLGEHPDRATALESISVDDLAVTADATQLYLVQASTGRPVIPRVLHALEASVQTPPLARFLAEVAYARNAVYGPFDFGVARTLPHLPRVRYGRTVLAPARWILSAADLPAGCEAMETWEKGLDVWRERWNVPTNIVLVQDELRLPLNLDYRLHRTVVRTRLGRAGQLELREAPGAAGDDWIDRPCELLVPLTTPTTPNAGSPRRPVEAAQAPHPVLHPGSSEVVHARLLGHPARYEEILTDHLPHLVERLGPDLVRWWFRRHRDTTKADSDQQLRLYLRLPDRAAYGRVAVHVADFARALEESGLLADLVLASYRPQTGRYGPDTTAAERVAATDSAAALTQMTLAIRTGLPSQAITAASMTDLASALAPAPETGYQWLLDQLPQRHGKLDRTLRDTTLFLADPSRAHEALRLHPGGEEVASAWETRRSTLSAYRDQLAPTRKPSTVLRSLLHDQHVRGLSVDPEQEHVTNRLARIAAMRYLALADRPNS